VGEVIGHERKSMREHVTAEIEKRLSTARGFRICGTYDVEKTYHALDVVTLNATWFAAKHDNPGPCPGAGWQAGPTGKRGKDADNKEVVRLRDEVRTLRAEVKSLRAVLEGDAVDLPGTWPKEHRNATT
jgi:hypothetical protein